MPPSFSTWVAFLISSITFSYGCKSVIEWQKYYFCTDNEKLFIRKHGRFCFHHTLPIQLRFNDVDKFGHVNNTVYFSFYDLGKTEYFATVCPEMGRRKGRRSRGCTSK